LPPPLLSIGANGRGNDVTHTAGPEPSSTDTSAGNGTANPPSKSGSHPQGPSQQIPPARPGTNTEGNHQGAEQAAQKADGSGANDTLLLTVLVLGFTAAVGGVVIAAGRRGGGRVH
jgi:hypothetical protein